MRTVLIVDDEPLVQVGLQSMIDWAALGVRLLPCASNGQAALETILAEHPALVITDIKMPLMDGLELIRRCRDLPERPVFIVLTSHEDFAFAREAVKHRVADYLVKLELTPESLARSVEDALAVLPAPRHVPEAAEAVRWEDLWEHSWTPEEQGGAFEPGWADRTTAVAVCRCDHMAKDAHEPAMRMLAEILGREYHVRSVGRDPARTTLILGSDGDASAAAARLTASMTAALQMVRKYFNGPDAVGLGAPGRGLASVGASYRQAIESLESWRGPEPLIVAHSETPPLSREAFRSGVEQALTGGDSEALSACFDLARRSVRLHGRLPDALDLGAAALYAVLAAPQGEALLASIFRERAEGPKSLYSVPSTAHVSDWLTELETGLRAHLESLGARHQENLVGSMQRFIENHYRERLQLKSLADQFRLSPNYAGSLFRRFAGRSFSEYVSEVKVAKAREMLATHKYRIYEISEYLGFENTYYFSKVFRRVAGLSPREFASGEEKDNSSVDKR